MDLQLAGKVAIVTGGSRGIGLAIALQLAREGAAVALAARDPVALQAAAARIAAETGGKALAVPADTRDDAAVQALVARVAGALGGVDILVNAAAKPGGEGAPEALDPATEALILAEIDTKLLGYLRMIRAVVPHMRAAGWGRIINISGLAARSSGSAAGSIRNVAVAALTKNLADELGAQGINVTVVHPGLTRTERIPGMIAQRAAAAGLPPEAVERQMAAGISIGRLVEAAEVAHVVTFLASPLSVAINGDALACGGGIRGPIHY